MKTEQAIRKLGQTLWDILGREYIDKYCEDKNGNLVSVSSISVEDIAEELVNAGYGDISEYKAEIERLRQEVRDTDKMARNTIEQYKNNYDNAFERLKAQEREIERLKANWYRSIMDAFENNRDKIVENIQTEIDDYKQRIKQAKIDVLNKAKERAVGLPAIETYHICNLIDELIKEVENE